jgi:hypothetical protein
MAYLNGDQYTHNIMEGMIDIVRNEKRGGAWGVNK